MTFCRTRLDTHLAYEADAAVLRVYTLPFCRPCFKRTLTRRRRIGTWRPARADRSAHEDSARPEEAREQRDGLDPLKLVAVTHECTLRQIVGSPEIMRDQLDELLVRSRDDNVSLYVFPFSAKPTFAMTCMWAYFEYQDPENLEQDLVQIETPAGFFTIEDPGEVARYRKAHDSLIDSSLTEEESRALILRIRDGISLSLPEPSPL